MYPFRDPDEGAVELVIDKILDILFMHGAVTILPPCSCPACKRASRRCHNQRWPGLTIGLEINTQTD